MRRDSVIRGLLRGIGLAIAVVAVVDPAVTSNRGPKPTIAVVAEDSLLANRVKKELDRSFLVVRGPASGVDATVVVGSYARLGEIAGPAFAILNDRTGIAVSLEDIQAPDWTPVDASARVMVEVRTTGARGRTLDVALRSRGLIVDRVSRMIAADDERLSIPLSFLPTAPGATHLTVSASIASQVTSADVLMDVRPQRWAVLFFDPRPSWMSTFVRRALERDSRFVITSRVVTSRDVSTDAGNPPARLNDLAALGLFDAIVVGAPEALSAGDVSGLEAFMRRRAGSVVLLFDRHVNGPYERLTQVERWAADSGGKATAIAPVDGDSGALRAAEMAWPVRLTGGAEPVAFANANRPVVWRAPVGAGQLIVSGAFDSWRFRDVSTSGFDHFWRTVVADAANAAPPPIDVRLGTGVLRPADETNVFMTIRDVALGRSTRASVTATLESEKPDIPAARVQLWPDGTPGEFVGRIRAGAPGGYRLVIASSSGRVEHPLVVADEVGHPSTADDDLLMAWINAHGGRTLPAGQIDKLGEALNATIDVAARPETWHPMRSVWWLIPFALALSGEWWLRRRRGLA